MCAQSALKTPLKRLKSALFSDFYTTSIYGFHRFLGACRTAFSPSIVRSLFLQSLSRRSSLFFETYRRLVSASVHIFPVELNCCSSGRPQINFAVNAQFFELETMSRRNYPKTEFPYQATPRCRSYSAERAPSRERTKGSSGCRGR
jgi:hypothetical protein